MAEQTFRSPGFFEEEIDLTERVTRPSGTPAGVIGAAKKGPAFVPVIVGSFADFQTKFGTLDPALAGPYAVREFLKNRNAVTFMRVLGGGVNETTDQITTTRTAGTVRNAGFKVVSTQNDAEYPEDLRYMGAVQFICAEHNVTASSGELQGFPVFSDNDSFNERLSSGNEVLYLVRAAIMFASGTRGLILNGGESATGTNWAEVDDLATLNSDMDFKIVVSSSAGTSWANDDSNAGCKIYSASLDPNRQNYISNVLNTDPAKFQTKQHLLYLDFAVENELASVSTGSQSICIMSGTSTTDPSAGEASLAYRNLFGRYNTRYTTPRTSNFISQPFGKTEHDLFYFETLSDGAYSNDRVKVSIANLRASVDPNDPFGTFEVQIRKFNDIDTEAEILERFPDCSLDPSSDRYVARQIGDKKVSFNWDADREEERRLVISGKYAVRSNYIRVIMNDNVTNAVCPADAVPFGFRGVPVLKTCDSLTDDLARTLKLGSTTIGDVSGSGATPATWRLACTGTMAREQILNNNAGGNYTQVIPYSASIVPPLPFTFKQALGAVAGTSADFIGAPGPSTRTDDRIYWGVKTTRLPNSGTAAQVKVKDAVLKSNNGLVTNPLVRTYTKFQGITKLDALVTGSGADAFNNNKFTLSRVALYNSAFTEVTGTATEHMKEAAYIRNGVPDGTQYKVNDTILDRGRVTLATLIQSSSVVFNRFTSYAKFTNVFFGGFDGLNILDDDIAILNDRASSVDTGGKASADAVGAAGLGLVQTDLNSMAMMGEGRENNMIAAYRQAIRLMTDGMVVNTNILSIPGIRDSYITDYAAEGVRDYSLGIYLMDMVPYDENSNRLFSDGTDGWLAPRASTTTTPIEPDVRETSEKFEDRAIDNSYSATYFPDVYLTDPIANRPVRVPASVVALGALGFNDQVSYPWFAPAGFNRGALGDVTNVDVRLTAGNRDTLYDARINPIATFPNAGFVIFGQKTMQLAKSALDRVNVRRLLLEVKRQVMRIANRLLFEQNNASTRARFVAQVTPQLALIQAQAGIEQFKVVCNATNNTQLDIENNRMNGRIVIVPTRVVEFIAIDFIVTNSGVSFE